MQYQLLILSAIEAELGSFIAKYPFETKKLGEQRLLTHALPGLRLWVSFTGLGGAHAAQHTCALLKACQPDLLIMTGTAGGLHAHQAVGDLLLASEVIDGDLLALQGLGADPVLKQYLQCPHTQKPLTHRFDVPAFMLNALEGMGDWRIGKMLTSQQFPAPPQLMHWAEQMQLESIDMEGSSVMRAAASAGTVAMSLRILSNILGEEHDAAWSEQTMRACSDGLEASLSVLISSALLPGLLEQCRQKRFSFHLPKIEALKADYQLKPHPEGGWYRRVFCSETKVTTHEGKVREAGSSIYYLLTAKERSAWHELDADETWFFHQGEPVCIYEINPKTRKLHQTHLGKNGHLQHTIKAGTPFSAKPLGTHALIGCSVMPAFNFKGFKLLNKQTLQTQFPEHKTHINKI